MLFSEKTQQLKKASGFYCTKIKIFFSKKKQKKKHLHNFSKILLILFVIFKALWHCAMKKQIVSKFKKKVLSCLILIFTYLPLNIEQETINLSHFHMQCISVLQIRWKTNICSLCYLKKTARPLLLSLAVLIKSRYKCLLLFIQEITPLETKLNCFPLIVWILHFHSLCYRLLQVVSFKGYYSLHNFKISYIIFLGF